MPTTSPPILIWQPGGGVPVGPVSNPPVYSQAGTTQLIEDQAYIDVVFGSIQTDDEWVFGECMVVNEIDAEPLNIWPGIVTDKTETGFRLQLNGMPDSGNYYLHWAVSGINIEPSPATSYLMTGPSSGALSVASSVFTVALSPSTTLASPVEVTMSDGGAGGVFSPTSVTLTTGSPSQTFTYTPSTYGGRTISVTNDGDLTDPFNLTYTSVASTYTFSGPSTGAVGVASTNFTVALPVGGEVIGSVTVTPSDSSGGGAFTPSTVNLSSGAPSATFTYTPTSGGAKTLSVTNNGGLTNPGSLTYTVVVLPVASDTFTDANGTALTAHTMDIGSGWFVFESDSVHHFTIQSNKATSYLDGGTSYSYVTPCGVSDCTVQVSVAFGVADAAHYCQIIFRHTDFPNHWRLRVNGSGSSNVELVKNVGGTPTIVGTGTLAITAGVSVLLKVILSGTSISAFAGATNLTTTDSAGVSAVNHGISSYQAAGAANTFEDFTVTP